MSGHKEKRALGLQDVIAGIVFFLLLTEGLYTILLNFPGLLGREALYEIRISGVLFLVIWGVLGNFLFKPFLGVILDREEKTEGYERRAAERKRNTKEISEQIEEHIQEARLEAIIKRDKLAEEARKRAREQIEQALKEAERERKAHQLEIQKLKEQASLEAGGQAEQLAGEVLVQAVFKQ